MYDFDNASCYQGDMVYWVRKTGGLKFERRADALAVVEAAKAEGYNFLVCQVGWMTVVVDGDC